jgi:threonine dehydratase
VADRIPSLDDVRKAAAGAMRGRVHRTPLMSSRTLGERVGAPVLLKAELFQRTGSFKLRGALNRVAAMSAEEQRRGVITVSAGNHAQGVALACAARDIDALVLMPATASEAKVAATRGYGATVDLESRDSAEAFARAMEIAEATGRMPLHPYADPWVIAGQGTVALEACEDAPAADVFIAPVGGGGLISGIGVTVKALRREARVIGVEAERTATLGPALEAGKPVAIELGPTIADALTAPITGALNLEICSRCVDEVVTVSEDEIAAGMRFLYQRAKLACEPAAAAPVAALLTGKVDVRGSAGVVAVVSGGNVAEATLLAALAPR